MAAPVAAQELTQSTGETTNAFDRRVRILHRVDIGQSIAIKIAGNNPLKRRDLRDPRQSEEYIFAVRLTEKNATTQHKHKETQNQEKKNHTNKHKQQNQHKHNNVRKPPRHLRDFGGQL